MTNAKVEEIAGIPLPADLDDTRPRAMVAVIDAKAGHADELRKVIVELVRRVRQEPGCVTFIPYQQHSTPGRFYLYEVYADLDAFKDHLRTQHVQQFLTQAATHSTSVGAEVLLQLDEIIVPP